MSTFEPFADDSASTAVGGLTVENGTERIALYGSLDITRDPPGLAAAEALLAVLTRTVEALKAHAGDLTKKPAPPARPPSVRNPFAPE